MKKSILILLLATSFLFHSCIDKYSGEPLGLENNSDYNIYYWFGYWKDGNYIKYHYPDTILPEFKPNIGFLYLNSTHRFGESDPNWEKIFSELPAGKFSVYFFEDNPETQADWDSIRLNYALIRKDVTYQELVENNYKIIYP